MIIVKRLLFLAFSLTISLLSWSSSDKVHFDDDSVEVSLLTCSPHNEVYSVFGHTALRYHDLRTGEDWAFNYGVFDFRKPLFGLRFTFGITDYELGVVPFHIFKTEYAKRGSYVVEQVLNLSSEEKKKFYKALQDNYRPENRIYRYNCLYDNCTTRARDMIERSIIDDKIEYRDGTGPQADQMHGITYRKLLHERTGNHRWITFGNDICLGLGADREIGWRERQFLPSQLMESFQDAIVVGSNKGTRPLVVNNRYAVEPGVRFVEDGFPLTPFQCFALLLVAAIVILSVELYRGKTFVVFDLLLMALTGTAGILVAALFFSQHPTTSTNLQILILNPLPFFFMANVARRRKTRYWKIVALTTAIFLFGSILQDYAEGMELLALTLLTRVWMNRNCN